MYSRKGSKRETMVKKELVKFIREARRRGYDDYQIREPLIKQGWASEEVEQAFAALQPKYKHKNRVVLYLDSKLLRKLELRAKKNMFTLSEQIEDILRRSALNLRRGLGREKLEDAFIRFFSRKKR